MRIERLPPKEQAEIASNVREAHERGDPVEIEEAEDLARRFGVISDQARDEMKLNLSEEAWSSLL